MEGSSRRGCSSRTRCPLAAEVASPAVRYPAICTTAAVGRKVPRKEGVAKVTGAARYVDDLSFPGMLHGATVRPTISRGEILSIRHDLGRDGFTVVDFRGIPGRNVVALIEDDQPCLAEREVRHPEEPILVLAHEEKEKLAAPKVEPWMVIAWIIRRRSSVMDHLHRAQHGLVRLTLHRNPVDGNRGLNAAARDSARLRRIPIDQCLLRARGVDLDLEPDTPGAASARGCDSPQTRGVGKSAGMGHGGPGQAIPVENERPGTTDTDRPDVVGGGGGNSGEIGVRPASFVVPRRVGSAVGTADLFGPMGAIPVPERRERLVRVKTSPLTHGPDVVAGGPGNPGQEFGAQATVPLHGNHAPGAPVPVQGKRRSSDTADGPDVAGRYRSDCVELIGPGRDIGTRHLTPARAVPMQDERLDRCFIVSAPAVSDRPSVVGGN